MAKYDEFKTYFPDILTALTDVDAFLQACGMEVDDLDADTFAMRDNNFVAIADETMIARWETFLDLSAGTRTLDERRSMVLSYIASDGKIGSDEIKAIVQIFTEYACSVAFYDSTVYVQINRYLDDTLLLDDCYFILRKKIPAHLDLWIQSTMEITYPAYIGATIGQYRREEL